MVGQLESLRFRISLRTAFIAIALIAIFIGWPWRCYYLWQRQNEFLDHYTSPPRIQATLEDRRKLSEFDIFQLRSSWWELLSGIDRFGQLRTMTADFDDASFSVNRFQGLGQLEWLDINIEPKLLSRKVDAERLPLQTRNFRCWTTARTIYVYLAGQSIDLTSISFSQLWTLDRFESLKLGFCRVKAGSFTRIAECPNLATIDLLNCELGDSDFQAICQVESLQRLNLEKVSIIGDVAEFDLSKLVNLRHLTLSFADDDKRPDRIRLPENIQTLVLHGIDQTIWEHSVNTSGELPELESLYINFVSPITRATPEDLRQGTGQQPQFLGHIGWDANVHQQQQLQMPKLQHLLMSNCRFDMETLNFFAAKPDLKTLVLHECLVDGNALSQLPQCKQLESLYLGQRSLDGFAFEFLKAYASLKVLMVTTTVIVKNMELIEAESKFTDPAPVLKWCPSSITHLHLQGQFSDPDLSSINRDRFPNLVELGVDNIPAETVNELFDTNPKLRNVHRENRTSIFKRLAPYHRHSSDAKLPPQSPGIAIELFPLLDTMRQRGDLHKPPVR